MQVAGRATVSAVPEKVEEESRAPPRKAQTDPPSLPATQEAIVVKLWRNAQRVSSEALAKEDMLPAFVALLATSAE